MRLLDDGGTVPLDRVGAYLTRAEATELLEALSEFFSDVPLLPEWHMHVESDDGRAKQLTVAIYDPNAPDNDARREAWYEEDRWAPSIFGETTG